MNYYLFKTIINVYIYIDKLGRLNTISSPPAASLDYVNPTHCSAHSDITVSYQFYDNIL